jgi:hypothetical protein
MATADAEAARDADIYNEDVIAYDRETLRDYTKEGSGITFDQRAAALRRQQEREDPTIRFDQAAPSASASNPQSAYPQSGGDYDDDDDDDESSDQGPSDNFASPSGSTEELANTSSPMDADDSEGPRLPAEEEGAESPQLAMPATLAPSPDSASVRVAESGEYRPSFLGGYVPTAREVANTPLPPTIKFNQIQRNRSSPTFPLTSGEKLRRVLAELKSSFATINAGSPDRMQAVSWILPLTSDPEQRAIGGLASMWFATLAFQYKSQLRPDDVRDNVYNGKYLRDQWAMFRLQTNAYAKLVDREMTAWFNGIVQETISDAAVEGEPSRDANSNNANRVHRALLDFSTIFETNAELAAVRQQRDEFQRLFALQRAENERFRTAPDFMNVDKPDTPSSPTVPLPSASTAATTPTLERMDIAALSQNPNMAAMRAARFARVFQNPALPPASPAKPADPLVAEKSEIEAAVRDLLMSSTAMTELRRNRLTKTPQASSSPSLPTMSITPPAAMPAVPTAGDSVPVQKLGTTEFLNRMREIRFTKIPVAAAPALPPLPPATMPEPVPQIDQAQIADITGPSFINSMRTARFTIIPRAIVVPPPPAVAPAPSPAVLSETTIVEPGQISILNGAAHLIRMREIRFTTIPKPALPALPLAPAPVTPPPAAVMDQADILKLNGTTHISRMRESRFSRLPAPATAIVPPPTPAAPAVLSETTIAEPGQISILNGAAHLIRMREIRFTTMPKPALPALPLPPAPVTPPPPAVVMDQADILKLNGTTHIARMRESRFSRLPAPATAIVPPPTPAAPAVADPADLARFAEFAGTSFVQRMRESRFTRVPQPTIAVSPPPAPAPLVTTATVDLGNISMLNDAPSIARLRTARFTLVPQIAPVARPPPSVPVVKQQSAVHLSGTSATYSVSALTINPLLASMRSSRFSRTPLAAAFPPAPVQLVKPNRFTQKPASRLREQAAAELLGVDERTIAALSNSPELRAMRTLRFTRVDPPGRLNRMFPPASSFNPASAFQPSVVFSAPPPPVVPPKELEPALFPDEEYLRQLISYLREGV